MNNLPNFPSFDVDTDKSNAGTRWEKWLGRLENLFVGLKVTDDDQKRALLLHYAGEKVYDIYDVEKRDTDATFEATRKVLNDYFAPKKNVQMEIYNFRSCKQHDTQSLDEFVTELRTLAKNCEFTNVDKEILQQVIQNCRSNQLRRRALREPDKALCDILTMGRMLEQSDRQAAVMENSDTVQRVSQRPRGSVNRRGHKRERGGQHYANSGMRRGLSAKPRDHPGLSARPRDRAPLNENTCRACGYEYPHKQTCPAKGKTCNLCKKPNHFSRCCRQRGIREVKLQSDSEDEYNYQVSVKSVSKNNKTPKTLISINNIAIKVTIDTGSSVNIIDENTYAFLGKPTLKTKHLPKLLPYGGGSNLKVKGCCEMTAEKNDKIVVDKFYLVKGNYGTLLGFQTASDLGVVKIIQNVNISQETIERKYPGIYEGIGKLKQQTVKLHVNKDVHPVAQKGRRTPFHLRKNVEKEIETMLKNDIIEEIRNESTPWVSPIVTPPKKNGDVRICVDMRLANKAIERERHPMPTIDELIHDLNGSKVFSKMDLKSGYNQLVLKEESRPITTFSTHIGLFRYKRLNFGTNSASEVFQKTISSIIAGIPGAKNISDDIIVYGKNQTEHDIALDKVFNALHRNGLTLNKQKCEFNKSEITFFGVVFNGSGISADPLKVEAIRKMEQPTNVSEIRSFLGMTAYCSRFIKEYATITEPLRRLTRNETPWSWEREQENAFEKLKQDLSSDTVMVYFDPGKEIEVVTDASPVGLSAILTQQGKVVAYASRALSPTESRYSQTEREALGVVWACEHYNMYLRGAPCFTVITDHKPLECIWKKKQPPLRIERWGLRLQPYKMNIVYKPGKDNPSDYLSRHPLQDVGNDRNLAEEYFIAERAVPNAMTLDEVKSASISDSTIRKAIDLTENGKWYEIKTLSDLKINKEELSALRSVKDELSVHCGTVLLRNDKIVMPKSLRAQAIKLGHEGHQGVVRTKSYIRSKVWFPNLNTDIETAIKGCLACQANTKEPRSREPLRMSEMPSGPWMNLSADFCGPLQTGDYLLVTVDEYSRYPIVEIVKSVSANTVIPVLDKIIAMFGVPTVIKTDNGSPFNNIAKPEQDVRLDELARRNDEKSKSHSKEYEDRRIRARERHINIGDKVLLRNETPSKCSTQFKPMPYTVTETKGPMISVKCDSGHRVTRNSSFMKKVEPSLDASNMDMNNNDDDLGDDLIDNDGGQNTTEVHTRPTRERRPPTYLSDYVRSVDNKVS
ncbi:uncharacterized protein K02A2.6-like [Mya arenaria]|uniref:uncharacterized protein K02A2.6-like n=1 Tax=Mya arenaria TaxID=6604 RepID=UPI0022E2BE78|nr:uncharacterized protein K02A2.6-like [Mya arenaria]